MSPGLAAVKVTNDAARNFHSGIIAQGVWGWGLPRVKTRWEAEAACIHCLQMLTAETINI